MNDDTIEYIVDSYAIKKERYGKSFYSACYDIWFSYERLYDRFKSFAPEERMIMIIPIYGYEKNLLWSHDIWFLCKKHLSNENHIKIIPEAEGKRSIGIFSGLLSDYQLEDFNYLYKEYAADKIYILHILQLPNDYYKIQITDLADKQVLYNTSFMVSKMDLSHHLKSIMVDMKESILSHHYHIKNINHNYNKYDLLISDLDEWDEIRNALKGIDYVVRYFANIGVVITVTICETEEIEKYLNKLGIHATKQDEFWFISLLPR